MYIQLTVIHFEDRVNLEQENHIILKLSIPFLFIPEHTVYYTNYMHSVNEYKYERSISSMFRYKCTIFRVHLQGASSWLL